MILSVSTDVLVEGLKERRKIREGLGHCHQEFVKPDSWGNTGIFTSFSKINTSIMDDYEQH